MIDFLHAALGFLHLAALVAVIVFYCRRLQLPWREWPLYVFLLLWAGLAAAGYMTSGLNELGSLPVYAVMSFAGVALVLALHYLTYAPPRKTPYAETFKPPVFTKLAPQLEQWLWIFLAGTFVIAVLVHLLIIIFIYPCNGDSMIYRLPRAYWYVSNGNLLHPFVSADKRITFYPLDGILLYVPLVLYRLPGTFHSIPSFFMWLAVTFTTYRFARELKADRLISCFAAWLVALTPNILVQATSTNDEILAGAAMLAGLFFAWRWLVSGAEHYAFLAALGVGLSAGTKLHIVFLLPVFAIGAAWFLWFLWRRRQSWKSYFPPLRPRTIVIGLSAMVMAGLLFTVMNYISSGRFYFVGDFAHDVFNLRASFRLAAQNLLIYFTQMILGPVGTLNFWTAPANREAFNNHLNDLFTPLIQHFISNDRSFYHLKYKFQGVMIPTTVLLVEFSLWPGFIWLLWPFQGAALVRGRFTLRPLFLLMAATPLIWLIVWACSTLYMEGSPTYFAFYLICAAPAMVFVFTKVPPRLNWVRWGLITVVVLTHLAINANVFVNNVFRGLRDLVLAENVPLDWLQYETPAVEEIRRARDIQIVSMHTLTYYFSFMHWNPYARYYSPYKQPDLPPAKLKGLLQITSIPGEFMYGFIPIRIPDKPTPGMTYLGDIRGVDHEAVFAAGNGVETRWPDRARYIIFHVDIDPVANGYAISLSKIIAGLAAEDHLEFDYKIKTADGTLIYERPFNAEPMFSAIVPHDPATVPYQLTVSIRSAWNYKKVTAVSYPLEGKGTWRILGYGHQQVSGTPDRD